jgi:hypothetical protein
MALLTACATTTAQEWPVAGITLPTGATPAALPPLFANDPAMKSSENVKDGMWFRCFNCPGGWDAILAHLEGCISPLGYTYNEFETKDIAPPQADPTGIVRVYASPSGKIKATLMNLRSCALYGDGFDGGGEYLIMVAIDK